MFNSGDGMGEGMLIFFMSYRVLRAIAAPPPGPLGGASSSLQFLSYLLLSHLVQATGLRFLETVPCVPHAPSPLVTVPPTPAPPPPPGHWAALPGDGAGPRRQRPACGGFQDVPRPRADHRGAAAPQRPAGGGVAVGGVILIVITTGPTEAVAAAPQRLAGGVFVFGVIFIVITTRPSEAVAAAPHGHALAVVRDLLLPLVATVSQSWVQSAPASVCAIVGKECQTLGSEGCLSVLVCASCA